MVIIYNNKLLPMTFRGSYTTLRDAVLAGNFPMATARRKFIFYNDGNGTGKLFKKSSVVKRRTMFWRTTFNKTECGFIKYTIRLYVK